VIHGDVNINVSEAQSTLAQMMGEAAWQWKTGALPTMMGAPPVPALA
jgi:hypothetical protein